jgi:DNA-binding transcriptional regulator YdaS (Cro superfamily)
MATHKIALRRAIALFGNQKAFAEALTKELDRRGSPAIISQQIVSYWCNVSGLPPEHCVPVEELLNFAITKHELCPKVFGDKPYIPISDATVTPSAQV